MTKPYARNAHQKLHFFEQIFILLAGAKCLKLIYRNHEKCTFPLQCHRKIPIIDLCYQKDSQDNLGRKQSFLIARRTKAKKLRNLERATPQFIECINSFIPCPISLFVDNHENIDVNFNCDT